MSQKILFPKLTSNMFFSIGDDSKVFKALMFLKALNDTVTRATSIWWDFPVDTTVSQDTKYPKCMILRCDGLVLPPWNPWNLKFQLRIQSPLLALSLRTSSSAFRNFWKHYERPAGFVVKVFEKSLLRCGRFLFTQNFVENDGLWLINQPLPDLPRPRNKGLIRPY